MKRHEEVSKGVFSLKVDESGRLVLPMDSHVRQAARAGELLVGVEDADGRFTVRAYSDVIREVQEYFAQFRKPGECWSDELIAERRAEALRE